MNSEKSFTEKIEQLEKRISELETKPNGKKNYFKKAFRKTNVIVGIAAAALATGIILYAAQITFTDGTVISAADVNNNFTELYDKTGKLESKILGDVIGADTTATVNYATWNDIPDMTLNINCDENSTVLIHYKSGSMLINNTSFSWGNFRIVIDGTEKERQFFLNDNGTQRTIVFPILLTQGSHSIKIQWKCLDSYPSNFQSISFSSTLSIGGNIYYSNIPRRLTVVKL